MTKKNSGRPKVKDKKIPFPIRLRKGLLMKYRNQAKIEDVPINQLMERTLNEKIFEA
jgi:hypothetical protein